MRDPRVRGVEWRDLVALSRWEVVRELCLPVPWLGASLVLAGLAWSWPVLFLPALGCSFVFFLTGLRVVHNAHHYALGLPRWATEWVMFVMSVFMLGSMHAVQRNHLQHHKHCMDDEDLEGYSARLSAWRALLYGPVFLVRLHVRGFWLGRRRHRRWILAELAAGALFVFFVCRPLRQLRALLSRGGHGNRPVHDLLLRRMDRAPRLRPLTPHRPHLARKSKEQGLLRDVLPPGAPPLPQSADLPPAQTSRPARQRRPRTASPSGFLAVSLQLQRSAFRGRWHYSAMYDAPQLAKVASAARARDRSIAFPYS